MLTRKLLAATVAALAFAGGALAQPPAAPKELPPVAPKEPGGAVVPAPASAAPEPPAFAPVDPRYSLRYDGGNGVGYRNGFFLLETFYPFAQVPGESLGFGNARVLNYMDGRFWEVQLGGGSRWVVGDSGAVFGVNAFYDGRNTDLRWYNQIGFGAELIGERWDLRANVYIPIGRQFVGAGTRETLSGPRFLGTNIAFDRTRVSQFESSMGGVDVEVGRRLPNFFPNVRSTAYLGFYHFSNDRVQTANGIRGRLETWVNDNLSLHMGVQQDAVFDTTFTGGVAFHFGGPRRGSGGYGVESRLAAPVSRQPAMVIQRKNQSTRTSELAVDPATGAPIEVRHANSGAAAGGDGSVERPFNTLGGLQTGSAPGQILFVHAGSAFSGEAIVLQANQRFLGEGIAHQFAARQGTFSLPRATGGTALPIIGLSPMTAVTLASGNEVSGFQIFGAGVNGITGTGIAGANLNRNTLTNIGSAGIRLLNVTGVSFVTDNVIANVGANGGVNGSGISFVETAGNSGTVRISGNQVFAITGSNGISAVSSRGTLFVQVLNNRVDGVTLPGVVAQGIVVASQRATVFAQVANNTVLNTKNDAITLGASALGTLKTQVAKNVTLANVVLQQTGGGMHSTEDVLGTNSVVPMLVGGTTVVPFGTFGFPVP